jgi:hypothetical protein
MRVGEILVKAGLLTPEQLARGLAAQAHYGGRLGTNLVELGFVSERQLAGALSEQLGLPYVSADKVGNISPSLIAMIPHDVAAEFRVFPITLKGLVLHVCLSDPSNVEKLHALGLRLSCPIQPCVVTEITLNYVLERYYGLRPELRSLPVKSGPAANAALVYVDEESAGHSGGARMSRSDFLSTESGEYFRGDNVALPDIAPMLAEAKTEADVVACIKHGFAPLFGQSVILSLSGASLLPVEAAGLELDLRLGSASIPLDEQSVLHRSIRDSSLGFHRTATDPTLLRLCQATGMNPRAVTVIPVMEKGNVRFLLLGHGLGWTGLEGLMPAIKRVLHQLSCALQIVSLRRQLLEDGSAGDSPRRAAL